MSVKGVFHPLTNGWRRDTQGYEIFRRESRDNKKIARHIVIMENSWGGPLPAATVVHHLNGDRDDNREENLLLCPDQAFHLTLHKREDALAACGNPFWISCIFCKNHDDPKSLSFRSDGRGYHLSCNREQSAAYYKSRREAK